MLPKLLRALRLSRWTPAARVFAGFTCVYLATVSGHYGGDGFDSYLTAESLVLDGDLAIHDRPFAVPELQHGARRAATLGVDGRQYSKYGVGLPLAEAPLYALGRVAWALADAAGVELPPDYFTMAAVSTLNAFVTAGVATLLFVIARRSGLHGWTSLLAPLAFGIGTFAWVMSRLGFAEPLFTLLALGTLVVSTGRRTSRPHPGEVRRAIAAGVLIGVMVHVKAYGILVAPLLLALAVHAAPAGRRTRAIVAAGAPIAVSIAVLAWLNTLRFGDPLSTGYVLGIGGNEPERLALTQLPAGFLGLLASPAFGLLWYAPVVFILAAPWRELAATHRALGVFVALWLGVHLVLFGSFTIWYGGFSWGPRYLYPVVPLLLLPLAVSSSSPSGGRAAWTLVALGAIAQLPPLLINFSRYFERFHADGYPHWDPLRSPLLGNWPVLVGGGDAWDTWFTTVPEFAGGTAGGIACGVLAAALLTLGAHVLCGVAHEPLREGA